MPSEQTAVVRDREALMERLAELPGAALGEGAFAPGPAIWAGRREIAHLYGDGKLDIRLTRAVIRERRDELRADPLFTMRSTSSDWVAYDVERGTAHQAIDLVATAHAANLPDAEPGPPPTGPELDRRRRFH